MTEFFIMDGFSKKRFFDLKGDTIHIGRSSDNDVQIKDNSVSRRHLEIIKKENRYFIKDYGVRTAPSSMVKRLALIWR